MNVQRLSIIVPARGETTALDRCLDALVHGIDKGSRYEIVVVGHGVSPEQARALREHLGPRRCCRFLHARTPTVAAALNRAVASSKGELLLFVDSATVAEEGLVASHWAQHAATPSDRAVVCGRLELDQTVDPHGLGAWLWAHPETTRLTSRPELAAPSTLCMDNISMSRAGFDAIGGLDPDLPDDRAAIDFGYRLARAGAPFSYAKTIRARREMGDPGLFDSSCAPLIEIGRAEMRLRYKHGPLRRELEADVDLLIDVAAAHAGADDLDPAAILEQARRLHERLSAGGRLEATRRKLDGLYDRLVRHHVLLGAGRELAERWPRFESVAPRLARWREATTEERSAILGEGLEAHPEWRTLHLLRARAHAADGAHEAAVEAYGRVLALDPEQPEARLARAHHLVVDLGRPQRGRNEIDALIDDGDLPTRLLGAAWLCRGRAMLALDDTEAARFSLSRSLQLAVEHRARVDGARAAWGADAAYELAELLARQGSYQEMAVVCRRFLDLDPGDPKRAGRIHALLAREHERTGRTALALAHHERVIAKGVEAPEALTAAHRFLARDLEIRGRLEAARHHWVELLRRHPTDPEATAHLLAAQAIGVSAGFLVDPRQIFAEDAELRARVYFRAGSLLLSRGEEDPAIECLARCLKDSPESLLPRYHLGSIFAGKQLYREALKQFERVIHRCQEEGRGPLDGAVDGREMLAGAYYHRGRILAQVQRTEEARSSLTHCLEVEPTHGPARSLLDTLPPPTARRTRRLRSTTTPGR